MEAHTKVTYAFEVVKAVAEAIRELGEVPSGQLYAALMHKMDLHDYEKIIGILKNTGLVKETNHLLQWKGVPGRRR